MEITTEIQEQILLVHLKGRMDAHGGAVAETAIAEKLTPDVLCMVLDMEDVGYMSSAGIRVVVKSMRDMEARDGAVAISRPGNYCRQVFDMSGLTGKLPIFSTRLAALKFSRMTIREKNSLDNWDRLETQATETGKFKFVPGSGDKGEISVTGQVQNVLHSTITENQVVSKPFSHTEYSIGLGGLGEKMDDYFPIMGEMACIGGIMVWLPTDGNFTPDFLIPVSGTGLIDIKTAFNVSIDGDFNEFVMFESTEPGGTRMDNLYRSLFHLAEKRRKDYKGILGLAIWAQMGSVFGSAITKSPVAENRPVDGGSIISPQNIDTWMKMDREPRFRDVTGLICGFGADLSRTLSGFNRMALEAAFYLHPSHVGKKTELLHNHGVVFSPMPLPMKLADLDKEIRKVVNEADFMDMCHLMSATTITRGFIGLSYTQEIKMAGTETAGAQNMDEVRRFLATQSYKRGAGLGFEAQARAEAKTKYREYLEQAKKMNE